MTRPATCQIRGCGTKLIEVVDLSAGETRIECPGCNRHAFGLCLDCSAGIPSQHHWRCRVCSAARERHLECERQKRKYRNNPEYRQRQVEAKRAARRDPATHAKLLERERASRASRKEKRLARTRAERAADRLYHRVWRDQHPLSAEQKQRNYARNRERYWGDPEYRERILAANRLRGLAYRARRHQQRRPEAA